jgi:hypothetical protein
MSNTPNEKVCAFIDTNNLQAFVVLIGLDSLAPEASLIRQRYFGNIESASDLESKVGQKQILFIKNLLKEKLEAFVSGQLVILSVQDAVFLYYLHMALMFSVAEDFQKEAFIAAYPEEKQYLESLPSLPNIYKIAIWDSELDTLRRGENIPELIWDNSFVREVDEIGNKCTTFRDLLNFKKEIEWVPSFESVRTVVEQGLKIAGTNNQTRPFLKLIGLKKVKNFLEDRWHLYCISDALKDYLLEQNSDLETEFYNTDKMDEHLKTLVDFCNSNKSDFPLLFA